MIKPPLGVEPRNIWLSNRYHNLARAIQEYAEADREINLDWVYEYNQLLREVNPDE